MTPSNANTSGLVEKLVQRARVSTDPLLAMYAVEASKVLVAAASAQARIAELSVSMTQQSDQWSERLLVMADRATAAEARADRLARVLGEALKTADWVIDFKGSSGSDRDLARMISEPIRRAALQQETQP